MAVIQIDRQTDKQTDRQTDRQTNRQTVVRQSERNYIVRPYGCFASRQMAFSFHVIEIHPKGKAKF